MNSAEGSGVGFATMRGRDFPTIRQFTVLLENRVGQLLEVVRRFEGSRVRIVALSINDATECALLRLLLSHPEQGREILERAGLAIIETDLIGVELPEGKQPLVQVCTALLQAEVNIVQAYPLIVRPHGNPAVALGSDGRGIVEEWIATKNAKSHENKKRREKFSMQILRCSFSCLFVFFAAIPCFDYRKTLSESSGSFRSPTLRTVVQGMMVTE
ncbi:MAG: hypothetical protein K8R36_16220 [Planctomycetales bacterium]|nr:hypothetical protein [Planctomycetales bacterium]